MCLQAFGREDQVQEFIRSEKPVHVQEKRLTKIDPVKICMGRYVSNGKSCGTLCINWCGCRARLGVVLSFMMGVTTLSLSSIIMFKKAVEPKLLGIFLAICVVGIIIVGYLFNAIQYLLI